MCEDYTKIFFPMFCMYKYYILLTLIIWCRVNGEDDPNPPDSTTENLSSLMMAFEKTDIPQKDVDDALILEVGKYSTMDFNYINDQYKQFEDPFNREFNMLANKCFDDYTKCLISQDNPTPVCGYNRNEPRWEFYGFRSFITYCDAFFDNCRRGYRHWRILDTGVCDYHRLVKESFRRWIGKTSNNIKKFLHLY